MAKRAITIQSTDYGGATYHIFLEDIKALRHIPTGENQGYTVILSRIYIPVSEVTFVHIRTLWFCHV